ncbi:G4 quadruplex nucleic acid binding protein [Balamuthia mandrillaris]
MEVLRKAAEAIVGGPSVTLHIDAQQPLHKSLGQAAKALAALQNKTLSVSTSATEAETPALIGAGDKPVSGAVAVLSAAASLSQEARLLGQTAEQKQEVEEWLAFPTAELGDTSAGFDAKKHLPKLNTVQKHLLTRTFLVSNHLTAADVALYTAVHPLMEALDEKTKTVSLCNVTRWFDLVQHQPSVATAAGLSVIEFPLNAPLAAKQDDKAKGGKQGEKGKQQQQKGGKKGNQQEEPEKQKQGEEKAAPTAAGEAVGKGKGKGQAQGQAKGKGKGGKQPAPKAAELPDIAKIDVRVGTIVNCQKHPDADALYLEQIDVGEEKPRTVVSGLVRFVPLEKMIGARVLCLCNLKPAKMRGVLSEAMVLCASNEDHSQVELIHPPEGVPNGERITFEGYSHLGEPEAQLNPKKKTFDNLKPVYFLSLSLSPSALSALLSSLCFFYSFLSILYF